MTGTLILIPTAGERQILKPRLEAVTDSEIRIRLCGFGPVAAAAGTSYLISAFRPNRIVLIGIAGALSRDLPPGRAAVFDEVAMYGIGAGTGDAFRTAGDLGWYHWKEVHEGHETAVGDTISLQTEPGTESATQLLTVCSAAATVQDARDRLARFPDAAAEDMEGFSVALACAMADVPLTIVRGISNIAGDRDKARWRIVDALNAAADLLPEILQ